MNQNAPLRAVTIGAGFAEYSTNTSRQPMAVHKQSAFQAVRNNTSHTDRVTRKGHLFIGRAQ